MREQTNEARAKELNLKVYGIPGAFPKFRPHPQFIVQTIAAALDAAEARGFQGAVELLRSDEFLKACEHGPDPAEWLEKRIPQSPAQPRR